MKPKFDFDDVLIQPAIMTDVVSRKDVNPFDKNSMLPLFTAPMDTVVNKQNAVEFLGNDINVCLPRGEETKQAVFLSYSLREFQKKYIDVLREGFHFVLIDMANGHMRELEISIRTAKEMYGDKLKLMVGNVAHPKTYKRLSEAGADYIRVGIGNGGGCLTTQQLGVGYPMGSLVRECYAMSCTLDNPAYIVADGGMKKYADIIKALALGADYVMVGSIFNKALESASPCLIPNTNLSGGEWEEIDLDRAKELFNSDAYGRRFEITKMFRGMSTKEVQKEWGAEELKTSEGIVKYQPVEYTIHGWVENFEHYLRSAMSYTNSFTLDDFIGKVETNIITQNAFNRFNK